MECIRFALDLTPLGASAKTQHDAVIKANLGQERGQIQLTVRSATMHGRRFTVSRRYGDQAVVLDDQDTVTSYQPKDILPGLEMFGQNEIYELTRDTQSRNQLIERFLDADQGLANSTIAHALQRLASNRASIIAALKSKQDIESEVETLPKLEEQVHHFRDLGLDEKLKIVPKLEKQRQLSQRSTGELERLHEAIQTLKDSLPDSVFLNDKALGDLPHAQALQKQRQILDALTEQAHEGLTHLQTAYQQARNDLTPTQTQLEDAIQQEEQKLEKAFKDIPSSQGKTGRPIGTEYQNLLRRIEQIKPKQAMLQSRQAHIDGLYEERKQLLHELSEARTNRADSMRRSVKRLNRRLDSKVRLTLNGEGERSPLFDFLRACPLEGVGPARLAWVKDLDFSPANLADRVRSKDEATMIVDWGVTPVTAQALFTLPETTLLEMEELALPDIMALELNIAHEEQEAIFRPIESLSTGQQCTAVLHLLLLDNQDPLILDQPEDNLDNAFIAERIVRELRQAKLTRQFLFATHNANIPVFGDAEWIGVLSVTNGKGQILPDQQGAIDLAEIQHLATDILEGGETAFNQRRQKYGFN